MEDLNLVKMSKSDIKKLSLVKNGDMGTTSKVYRLNDYECLKYFNYSMDEYDMYRLNKFTNLRFEGANLPNKLVIVNNKFRGYITDFINGETLETFNGLDYSEFVKSASTLLDNVHNISMERIRILDSHEGNIMYNYDKGMLEITDPVEWCFDSVSSKDEVWNKNFRLVNATIRKYLFSTDDIYNPSLYIPDLSEIEPSSDFVSYYEEIRDKMEEAKVIKIKTIFDARRYI